ncbi:MAG: rhodanese-like domain-containing protein [Neisseria sp.]|nr:rhodanese-like domain-containing protein [Neisseria sp.]
MTIPQLNPKQVQQLLTERDDVVLLDVREDDEVALCSLPNHVHIPMNLIPLRHNELPDDKLIIVYCHHGMRSLQTAMFLQHVGFDDVTNLQGGIEAWAVQLDPKMPRY